MFLVRILTLGPFVVVALAGLTGAAAAASAADDAYDTQSRTVSVHGLDLRSPAGQAALRNRILNAAASVCERGDTHDLTAASAADYDRCREQAVADASAQANVLIARADTATIAVADAAASRP